MRIEDVDGGKWEVTAAIRGVYIPRLVRFVPRLPLKLTRVSSLHFMPAAPGPTTVVGYSRQPASKPTLTCQLYNYATSLR